MMCETEKRVNALLNDAQKEVAAILDGTQEKVTIELEKLRSELDNLLADTATQTASGSLTRKRLRPEAGAAGGPAEKRQRRYCTHSAVQGEGELKGERRRGSERGKMFPAEIISIDPPRGSYPSSIVDFN